MGHSVHEYLCVHWCFSSWKGRQRKRRKNGAGTNGRSRCSNLSPGFLCAVTPSRSRIWSQTVRASTPPRSFTRSSSSKSLRRSTSSSRNHTARSRSRRVRHLRRSADPGDGLDCGPMVLYRLRSGKQKDRRIQVDAKCSSRFCEMYIARLDEDSNGIQWAVLISDCLSHADVWEDSILLYCIRSLVIVFG